MLPSLFERLLGPFQALVVLTQQVDVKFHGYAGTIGGNQECLGLAPGQCCRPGRYDTWGYSHVTFSRLTAFDIAAI